MNPSKRIDHTRFKNAGGELHLGLSGRKARGAGYVLTSGGFFTGAACGIRTGGRRVLVGALATFWVLPSLVSADPERDGASDQEILGAVQAEAVDSAEEAEEPLSYAGVEEVTVTARRREERLQETPVSVTAFDASALASRGVTELSELARYTPGWWFQSSAA